VKDSRKETVTIQVQQITAKFTRLPKVTNDYL